MSISVVIVTKNRAPLLKRCLSAFLFQTHTPAEMIIIDNNSSDETAEIVHNFTHAVAFPVLLISEKKSGYPIIYNRGIDHASSQWVGVIDDDCIVREQWIEKMEQEITRHPDAAAVLGFTDTQNSQNSFSLLTHLFDLYWKENGVIKNRVIDFEILDNKNIVYNKQFLQQKKIRFDESRAQFFLGAGEDSDLGRQIELSGGKAYLQRNAIAAHKDPDNLTWFVKKYLSSYAAYLYFREKWHTNSVRRTNQVKMLNLFRVVVDKTKIGLVKSVAFALLVVVFTSLSFLLTKLVRFSLIKKKLLVTHNSTLQVTV